MYGKVRKVPVLVLPEETQELDRNCACKTRTTRAVRILRITGADEIEAADRTAALISLLDTRNEIRARKIKTKEAAVAVLFKK